jgi:hypothetical protein
MEACYRGAPKSITSIGHPATPRDESRGQTRFLTAGERCQSPRMITTRRDLLRWQFDLTWSLLELHLEQLTPDDLLWEPAAHIWTVRPRGSGTWEADWAETEPDPIPVPTAAWVSWHIGWWWSVTIDHVRSRRPRDREEIGWPGPDAAVAGLRGLREEWLAALDRLTDRDLDHAAPFPWPDGSGLTLAHTLAWVNAELMKNTAEIGQLRLLRAASAT